LKRDWNSGAPLEGYKMLYDDILYAIDPTGGVFFKDVNKMQEYFKTNSICLLQIIDFANIQKSNFIENQKRKI